MITDLYVGCMEIFISKPQNKSDMEQKKKAMISQPMATWKDKQFVKELRKVLEFSASPIDMEDEINNLIQKYENL